MRLPSQHLQPSPKTGLRAAALSTATVLLLAGVPALAQGTIAGTVVTEGTNAPVASAQVTVVGQNVGTIADAGGRFRLTLPQQQSGEVELDVRRIGYRQARVRAQVGDEGVRVVLSERSIDLEAVVTTGTVGATARKELGNAVSRIDAAEEANKGTVKSLQDLLNGRAAGVVIQPATGAVGSGSRIRVRGTGSFALRNEPLIYVDGIRTVNDPATGPANQAFGSSSISRLNDINPDDIESIEIIKGPAAATLYGTEASSGVIQIITKKGSAGRARWNLTMKGGLTYLDDPEGRFWTNYQCSVTPAAGTFCPAANVLVLDIVEREKVAGRNIWQTGQMTDLDLNVTGGSQVFNYFVGGGMENTEGAEPNNAVRRQSARANLTLLPSDKVTIAFNVGYVNGLTKLSPEAGFGGRVWTVVLADPRNLADQRRGFHSGTPEQYDMVYHFDQRVDRITGGLQLSHTPLPWLRHRLNLGLDRTAENNVIFLPRIDALRSTAIGSDALGSKTINDRRIVYSTVDYAATGQWTLTPTLAMSTSVGLQYYRNVVDSIFGSGNIFPAPGLTALSSTTTSRTNAQDLLEDVTVGMYAQQQLSWNDRVFLTAAIRADDNSAFGQNFDRVYYPKFSASWVVSDESFFALPFVNTFRLRAAYGESGKQPATYSAVRAYVGATGPNDVAAVTPQFIGNPDLSPERGKEIEGGFEAGLLNDRLGIEFTYYNKRTVAAILEREIPPSLGIPGTQPFNAGEIRNSGIELLARAKPVSGRFFDWDLSLSIASNDNEVVSLGAEFDSLPLNRQWVTAATALRHQVGFPVGSWFEKRITSATLDANGNATNVMCDNGTGGSVACASAPLVYLGRTTPDVEGAVTNTFTLWKNLRLFALVDFKQGYRKLDGNTRVRCGFFGGRCRENIFPLEFDPKRIAAIQSSNTLVDYLIDDASFTKLREVSATYTLPDAWAAYARASRASISLAGRNLYTWTNYGGLEPEAFFLGGSRGGNHSIWEQTTLPQLTQWVVAINLGF
jgi:TonB-linked SusC/RagA family outer membrane protein